MTEQTNQRPVGNAVGQDGLYQQIVVLSALAVQRWAHVTVDSAMDLMLWPRDRGEIAQQREPYRVNSRRVEQGIWRLTLSPEQPAGTTLVARGEALKAEIAMTAADMSLPTVDQIVQCGLFGEVIYP